MLMSSQENGKTCWHSQTPQRAGFAHWLRLQEHQERGVSSLAKGIEVVSPLLLQPPATSPSLAVHCMEVTGISAIKPQPLHKQMQLGQNEFLLAIF